MTITRTNLAEAIAEEIKDTYPHISQKEVEAIIKSFLSRIVQDLLAGHRIELRGFGVFFTRMRRAKTARNPKTEERFHLPPRRVVAFKPSRLLKKELREETKEGG
jgi:integration host factor subunit beta|uniref:Integration host factor subunit beta n=1 Tax=candidate division WOR-3 bacterium TaxID=2052148 RepID=A0A7C3YSI3_UNCW3